ncbi:HAD family hydrolase [Virgibacillus ihumii]|uniref:HAD family hydrolase n=1 Tax=Virgibacillus ihumii TaxID=2686091 RepID=UPI00157BEDB2|nr:HAD family hydrolase [Virgibacillus ihumii]
MMTYKILFLDIDGTILKPDHTISDQTKQSIKNVTEQGVQVFFATGRPIHELDQLAGELDVHSYIGYNGAYAVHKGKTVLNEPISRDIIQQFLDIGYKHGHDAVLYTGDANYFTTLSKTHVNQFIDAFKLKQNKLFTGDKTDQILGATLLNVRPSEETLYDIDPAVHLSPVQAAGVEDCYDVIRKNVNKGKAVEQVLKLLEIKPEEAIAFGDGMNDKEMLASVGESFAMDNSHPDLFQHAKHRTTSVTDDGIANGLKKLGL